MTTRREAIASMEAAVRGSSPRPSESGVHRSSFTRKTKTVRSISGETLAPHIDVDVIVDKIKNVEDTKLRDTIQELTKTLEVYRKINILKDVPAPVGVSVPDSLPAEDLYKYATEFPPYVESWTDLTDEPFVEEDRRMTMLSMFAFLYNAKKMKHKDGESPIEFYEKCKDRVEDTIILFRENAKERGLELPAYINEMRF